MTSQLELLGEIKELLGKASALNGGFEEVKDSVNKMEAQQDELIKKVDKMSDAIFDPKTGLTNRMTFLETKIETIDETKKTLESVMETSRELIKIGSDPGFGSPNLNKLGASVKFFSITNKLYWMFIASAVTIVIKIGWEFIGK